MTTMNATIALAALLSALNAAPAMAEALDVNGIALPYEDAGTGPVVLFVHGMLSDRRIWEPYREQISRNRRFVAYDQRYFGASDWPDAGENFSVDTHSDDLIGFVEALEAGPVSVVSWSYGGDVVARAAVARPDLFHALVFYEPDVNGLIDSLPGSGEAVDQMLAGLRPAFAAVEEGRLEDAALRLIEGVFSMPEGGAKTEPEEILRIFRENSRAIPAFLAAPAGDRATCEELGNVRVPTLVVRGSDGFVLDAMVSERVVQCMPNAIIAILNGVTHDGPYRKPDVFAEMIDSFLKLFD